MYGSFVIYIFCDWCLCLRQTKHLIGYDVSSDLDLEYCTIVATAADSRSMWFTSA